MTRPQTTTHPINAPAKLASVEALPQKTITPKTLTPKTFTDPVLSTAMQDQAAYQRLHAHISRVWQDADRLKVLAKWNTQMEGLTDQDLGGAPGKLRLLIMTAALIPSVLRIKNTDYQKGDAQAVLNAFWGRADLEDLTAYQRTLFQGTCHRITRIHKLLIARCKDLCPHCGHEAGSGPRCQTCNRFLSIPAISGRDGEVAA